MATLDRRKSLSWVQSEAPQGNAPCQKQTPALRQQIDATWAKSYPTEKILKAEASGDSRTYTKVEVQSGKPVKRVFCSQAVRIAAKRANGSEATFSTSWHYEVLKGRKVFSHHASGNVEEAAASGDPTNDEMKQLCVAATDKVRKVLMSTPRKASASHFAASANVYVTSKEGKNEVCKAQYVTIKKSAAGEGWEATFLSKVRANCWPDTGK